MSCRQSDTDLLLLGLGELGPIARLRTARHLRGCARCRSRTRELTATSRRIARVLAPPHDAPVAGPGRPAASGVLWPGPWRLMRTALVAATLLGLAAFWFAWRHSAARTAPIDDGCRPGIASDRCR